ncbi:hypothetical protein RJ639_019774 [Escallonia herrerae]|uniref:DUF4378 domain-containing protein n=1 Tax=Escallonia herrerae TaxID=1293975 RepID=A0AA88V7P1_9ASTE|nr:hypothetical protein RJ639_019774 [Escallonia herrerae]
MGNPQTLFSSMGSSVYDDDDDGGHGGGPATSRIITLESLEGIYFVAIGIAVQGKITLPWHKILVCSREPKTVITGLVLWAKRKKVKELIPCQPQKAMGELDEQNLLRSKDHQTLMAKRSRKRLLQYEKDQAGCIWGFISIFDFRYGRSTRKLLSDRRRGSKRPVGAGFSRTKVKMLESSHEKYQGIEVGEESEMTTAAIVKTSVKELMEEEMFSEQGSKKQMDGTQVEAEPVGSEHGGRSSKSHKRTNKTRSKSCEMHVFDLDAARNSGQENSCHHVLEQKTSSNLDLRILVEELCQIHRKSTNVKCDWPDNHDMLSNQAYSVLEEKLSAAIMGFLDGRCTHDDHLAEDAKALPPKEFIEALQTLSSNKELLFKLLQDPNSLLVKHLQSVEDFQIKHDQNPKSLAGCNLPEGEPTISGPEEHINWRHRSFFRRKSKSQDSTSMKENETNQPSSRIVILKPGPASLQNPDNEINASTSMQPRDNMANKTRSQNNASQFSFTLIGRKLKHAMGKERHGIFRGGIMDRFPSRENGEKTVGEEDAGWSSPNRDHFYTERFAKPPVGIKKGDRVSKLWETELSVMNETNGCPKQGVSNIYIEAKKHLSEMLSEGDDKELMSKQLPKSLGRILSLPEYNISPSSSPGKDGDHSFVTAQMRLSPQGNFNIVNEKMRPLIEANNAGHLSPSRQEFGNQSCVATIESRDNIVQSPNSCQHVSEEHDGNNSVEEALQPMRDDMSCKGVQETEKTVDTENQEVGKLLDVLCEPSSHAVASDVQIWGSIEERSSISLNLDSLEEDQLLTSPSLSPSSSSVTRKIEDPESIIDRTGRPSPRSVLEPLFTEDDISPASNNSPRGVTAIQPLHIHFEERASSATSQAICIKTCIGDEESAFEYVEAVLLASGLDWDEYLLRWISVQQLLDTSLFDEVELFSNRSSNDQKLLFDCTNEILKEVCERCFGCSFAIRNIRPVPKGMNLINEVWEGVEWRLVQQPPPCSLDQLVGKDMSKSGTWMDLRFKINHIVMDLGNSILEELTEDAILDFVSGSMEFELSVPG